MRGGRFGRRGRTLIIGVVLALAARGVQAGSGISDNILVFQKHTISSNDSQIAVSWNAIGGAEEISVQDLFATSPSVPSGGLIGATTPDEADRLYLWNPATADYTVLFRFDSGGSNVLWDGHWVYNDFSGVATNTIRRGDAFWLFRWEESSTEVMLVGELPTAPYHTWTWAYEYAMFGSAYPVDVDLNAEAWPEAIGGIDFFDSDRIMMWHNDSTGGYRQVWFFDSGGTYPEWDRVWIENGNRCTNALKRGQGAWFRREATNAMSWTQDRPYDWP